MTHTTEWLSDIFCWGYTRLSRNMKGGKRKRNRSYRLAGAQVINSTHYKMHDKKQSIDWRSALEESHPDVRTLTPSSLKNTFNSLFISGGWGCPLVFLRRHESRRCLPVTTNEAYPEPGDSRVALQEARQDLEWEVGREGADCEIKSNSDVLVLYSGVHACKRKSPGACSGGGWSWAHTIRSDLSPMQLTLKRPILSQRLFFFASLFFAKKYIA